MRIHNINFFAGHKKWFAAPKSAIKRYNGALKHLCLDDAQKARQYAAMAP